MASTGSLVITRVEYALTEAGEALRGVVDGMCDWTQRYLSHIDASRRRFGATRS